MSQQSRPNRKRLAIVLTLALVTAAASLVAVRWLPVWRQQVTNEAWRRRIATTSEEHLSEAMAALAETGDHSVPLLVELLGSERPEVKQAAWWQLTEQMHTWRELAQRDAAPRIERLASELAKSVTRFDDQGKRLAARLTQQVLLWPVDRGAIDAEQFNSDCERLVAALADHPAGLVVTDEGSTTDAKTTKDASPTERSPMKPTDLSENSGADQLLSAPIAGDQANEVASSSTPSPIREAQRSPVLPAGGQSAPIEKLRLPARLSELRREPERRGVEAPQLDRLPVEAVMGHLHHFDRSLAEAARAELRRRGMTDAHLHLAVLLTDSEPAVRLALVEELQDFQGVEVRPWLLWLSEDEDAEVRMAALTMMATSSDPALQRRVIEIARSDGSPRVAELADRLLNRR